MFNNLFFIFQLAKLEIQEIPFDKEDEDPTELKTLEPEDLENVELKQLEYQLQLLEDKLAQAKPNLAVIHEYKKKVIKKFFSSFYNSIEEMI